MSVHALSKNWAAVKGYYRFLQNERVTEDVIISKMQQLCYDQARGKTVIAIADTTEINCESHKGRLKSKKKLGPLSDNHTWGYLMHPVYCLNAHSGFPIGIANVRLWNRTWKNIRHTRHQRCITDKEADKWFSDLIVSRDVVLGEAEHITYVMDREADNYAVLDHIPDDRTDVVVRSWHDRLVYFEGERIRINQFLDHQQVIGRLSIRIDSRNRRNHTIHAQVKCAAIEIEQPQNGRPFPEGTRSSIPMYIVEIKEVGTQNKDRLWWKLLTSKTVSTFEQALEIIDIYKQRWQIEELFRLIKTESFDLESSALGQGNSLRKLGLFVLEASVKIAQLKSARSEESPIRIQAIFSDSEIACLAQLNRELSGNTYKQANPFDPQSLSWGSWIIARLGGWKAYQSQRPPGSLTYKRGLERFENIHLGFHLKQ